MIMSLQKHYLRSTKNLYSCVSNGVTVYYSYVTPVAILDPFNVLHVCENVWSVTTGRHLTWIDGGTPEAKKKRLSYGDFQKLKDIYGVEREYWLNSSYIRPKTDTVPDIIKFDEMLPDRLQLLKI
jgi:hypothetical protein